jgi:hypothetical protein
LHPRFGVIFVLAAKLEGLTDKLAVIELID